MTIQLPSLLSFERKIELSDALMYSGNWHDLPEYKEDSKKDGKKDNLIWGEKIGISQRFNRSTQSAHGIKDSDKTEPNPVSSGNDDANLQSNNDTLKVSFTVRVIGNLGAPFACNDPDFERMIKSCVNQFKENGSGLSTLAYRYAYNIANGRFLWRNRVCAEEITIHVFHNGKEMPLEFKAYDYSLKDFDKNSENENLQTLAQIIQTGLSSENDFVFIKVDAYVKMGNGQHVFPSEEMNMNEKGKTLFQLNECAAMHNVKIGNAIRTIDDWYSVSTLIKDGKKTKTIDIEAEDIRPIAIEPYGSVTQRGCAYRANKEDLYTLMINWLNEKDKEISDTDKNYVIANLIRGGVFSKASSK